MNFISENPETVDDVRFLLTKYNPKVQKVGHFLRLQQLNGFKLTNPSQHGKNSRMSIAIAKTEEMPPSTIDTDIEDEDNADTLMPGTPSPHKLLEAMSILSEWYGSRCDTRPEDFQSLRRMQEYAVHQILDEATRKKGT